MTKILSLLLLSIIIISFIVINLFVHSKAEKFKNKQINTTFQKNITEKEQSIPIECPPFTYIDPDVFVNLIYKYGIINDNEYQKINTKLMPIMPETKIVQEKLKKLRSMYKTNKEVQIQLSLLLYYIPFNMWEDLWIKIMTSEDIITAMLDIIPFCKKLNGNNAIGVVIIESSLPDGPKFSNEERQFIKDTVFKAHKLLKDKHPTNNINWLVDIQEVKIDVPNGRYIPSTEKLRSKFEYDKYWTEPGIRKVRFNNKSFENDGQYHTELMNFYDTYANTNIYFITPYECSWPAYAKYGLASLIFSNNKNYLRFGKEYAHKILAHEICHLYGALDEYGGNVGTPCTSCDVPESCNTTVNGNCENCVNYQLSYNCIMRRYNPEICIYTKAQIGWIASYIKVRIVTTNDWFAGTDNKVTINFYTRSGNTTSFTLDKSGYDNLERGKTDYFLFPVYYSNDPITDYSKYFLKIFPRNGIINDWKLYSIQVWTKQFMSDDLLVSSKTPRVELTSDNRTWRSF